jgi:hypothetical protein
VFLTNTFRNLTQFPVYQTDNIRIRCRNRELANEAWKAWHKAHGEKKYSRDFAYGFEEGYWDYLEYGGSGNPPSIPPFCYRLMPYQNPQGIQAIEDWFAGFRVGAQAAMVSGLREQFVLPLSDIPITAGGTTPTRSSTHSGTDKSANDKGSSETKPHGDEKLPPVDEKLPLPMREKPAVPDKPPEPKRDNLPAAASSLPEGGMIPVGGVSLPPLSSAEARDSDKPGKPLGLGR